MATRDESMSVDELARRGGVSRRTVRYYVQRDLLPPPHGRGRGDHYGPAHLERLLRIKAMQERGLSLEEIRAALAVDDAAARRPGVAPASAQPAGPAPPVATAPPAATGPPPLRERRAVGGRADSSLWTRIVVSEGVELHLAAAVVRPDSARLAALVQAVRAALASDDEKGEGDDERS